MRRGFAPGPPVASLFAAAQRAAEHSDERQVPILFAVVESVTDNEFVADVESDEVRLELGDARFLFAQQNAEANAQWPRVGAQFAADGVERATGIEDVIDNEDMAAVDIRRRDLIESDHAAAFRSATVTGDAHAFELQGERDAAQQIGSEHERAVEHRDDRQLASLIFLRDGARELIEPAENRLLVKEDT